MSTDQPPARRPRPVRRYSIENQLVVLAEQEQADRVRALVGLSGLSQAEILRQIVTAGLPAVERRYKPKSR